jgi:hypothetical protein
MHQPHPSARFLAAACSTASAAGAPLPAPAGLAPEGTRRFLARSRRSQAQRCRLGAAVCAHGGRRAPCRRSARRYTRMSPRGPSMPPTGRCVLAATRHGAARQRAGDCARRAWRLRRRRPWAAPPAAAPQLAPAAPTHAHAASGRGRRSAARSPLVVRAGALFAPHAAAAAAVPRVGAPPPMRAATPHIARGAVAARTGAAGARAHADAFAAAHALRARRAACQERPDKRFRLAVGSFLEEYNNKVDIITARAAASLTAASAHALQRSR